MAPSASGRSPEGAIDPRGRVPIIRVGIAPEVTAATISCDGEWRIGWVGRPVELARLAAGRAWRFTASAGRLSVRSGQGSGREIGRDTLYAHPLAGSPGPMRVDGRAYRGELLIFAAGGNRLSVVNVVDLESYLRGVVPAEIGAADEERLEAVKAQAVAARSYTLAHLNRWRERGFDLLPTAADQVYLGMGGERRDVDRALLETCGIVALHDGRPIEAFYSSTCGGITAEADEVWRRPARSYLKARRDRRRRGEEAFCAASPYYRWSETWSGEELEKILKRTLPAATGRKEAASWGRLRDLRLKKKTKSRRVEQLEIAFERETFRVGRDEVRWILRRPGGGLLRSALLLGIEVQKARGRVARVRVRGAGFGHGVGLCQYGALGMSRAGYDYKQILRFYYQGIRLVRAYRRCPD